MLGKIVRLPEDFELIVSYHRTLLEIKTRGDELTWSLISASFGKRPHRLKDDWGPK
jgi:hypothetical protein